MIGRVHEESERGLENLVDFVPVDLEHKRGFYERDQGGDPKSGACKVGIKPAERFNVTLLEPDFLARLAQRRLPRRLAGVDLPAGKCDLAGMGAQSRRPQRQQNGQSLRPFDDGQKDGGGASGGDCGRLRALAAKRIVARTIRANAVEIRETERKR